MEIPRNMLFPSYEGLALIIEELKVNTIIVNDGVISIYFQDAEKEPIHITPAEG